MARDISLKRRTNLVVNDGAIIPVMVLPSGNTPTVGYSLANVALLVLVTTHLLAFKDRATVRNICNYISLLSN